MQVCSTASEILSLSTYNYEYGNYVPNAQSYKYGTITLNFGYQKFSGDMWLVASNPDGLFDPNTTFVRINF